MKELAQKNTTELETMATTQLRQLRFSIMLTECRVTAHLRTCNNNRLVCQREEKGGRDRQCMCACTCTIMSRRQSICPCVCVCVCELEAPAVLQQEAPVSSRLLGAASVDTRV